MQASWLFNVLFDKQIDTWFLMKLQNARNWFVAKMVFPATIAIQLHLPAWASPLLQKPKVCPGKFIQIIIFKVAVYFGQHNRVTHRNRQILLLH